MVAVLDQPPISFDEFIAWYPDTGGQQYELRRGVITEMPKPRGKHSELAGFLINQLNRAIEAQHCPYFIPRECIIKTEDNTGYEPDIAVVDRPQLMAERRWESASVLEQGSSIKLVVEVVSSNWRDDYALKLSDYEAMGIEEYWIVDYLGLGGRRYIGSPKQPTISICELVDGEYEVRQLRVGDRLQSKTMPAFEITVRDIFNGYISSE